MKNNTVIFNPDEKIVLLHVLFKDNQKLQLVMKKIIAEFEEADFEKLIKTKNEELSILTLIDEDKERLLPQLAEFYENYYGLKKDDPERAKLEAGIFYTICKIMLVRCNYRKGLNKLLYAATFSNLPPKFIPLYLFRMGSIYIEQGKIQEASDILTLAAHRCKSYVDDPIMARLELLILFQLLRVNIIRGNLIEAKRFIDDIDRKLGGQENIIFLALRGYYLKWAGELDNGYKILNDIYNKHKDNKEIKETYARSWFNIMYQLVCCILEKKEENHLARAKELILKAYSITESYNYRNLGYCENILGRIAMEEGDLGRALEHFQKAYALFDKYADYRNMARSKRNLGTVYAKMKNYYESLKNFNQSLDYDNHTQLELGIVQTLLQKIDLRMELVQYYKARDYLEKVQKIKLPIKHFFLAEIDKRREALDNIGSVEGLIGESKFILEIRNEIESYSHIAEPLLIMGETGTGKSFIAKEIHKKSNRKGEFITANCQLIPPANLENEIFGYKSDNREIAGLLEKANNGTLFFNEVCDLPVQLQTKLSRFINEKKTQPAGGGKENELDVKIIFATKSNNMEAHILNGVINRDFYNRISAFKIKVPPLRRRREDIRKLAEFFYITQCKDLNKKICGIKPYAMSLLEDYPWPDNVGELKKTIRRCVVKLENELPIDREHVIKSLDNQIIATPIIIDKKTAEDTTEDIRIITRLKSLEEKLQKEQEAPPPRTRIADSYSIINEVFKIIQKQGPVRKSEIISSCPNAEKSFHHWINILKDKYEVIKVEHSGNFKAYSAVPRNILDSKFKSGKLTKTDDIFYVVE